MDINIGELLKHRAMLSPNKVGLTWEGRSYTFSELNGRANKAGHAIEGLGVRPRDRVALLARNRVEYFDLFFGLAKTGVVLVPVNHRLAAPEIAEIMDDAGARALVYEAEFADVVERLAGLGVSFKAVRLGGGAGPGADYDELLSRANTREPLLEAANDDEAVIIHAIWAMGRPRGVMLTHENFFWSAVTLEATITDAGPTHLISLPLFHIGGLGWLPALAHRGGRCVLMPRFEPERFVELVGSERVTAFGVVPTMLHFLKDTPDFGSRDFSGVRCVLSYGQALPVGLVGEYDQVGLRIRNLYGLTESTGPALVIDAENALAKAGSCGLPFFHTRVDLADEHGGEVRRGAVGEVVIAGSHVMKGYWNQPEATADTVRRGWLYTGDLARRDDDGFYYIVDRKKEMIISGGENISPSQIEGVMLEHEGIADVAILGMPDAVWGEQAKAVVVRKPGSEVTARELISHCRGRIADFKVPRRIEFHDGLPRTLAGKLAKRVLRDGE